MTDKIVIYRDDINLERAVDALHRGAEYGVTREEVSDALWIWLKAAVDALVEDAAYYVDRIADCSYQPDEPERNAREIERDRTRELECRLRVHDALYFNENEERDRPTLELARRHPETFDVRRHNSLCHVIALLKKAEVRA
jgi:hypothetical protein